MIFHVRRLEGPATQIFETFFRGLLHRRLNFTSCHFRCDYCSEEAIALGRPMLLEDVLVELDPCLDNVLEKNYFRQGRALKVKVGDKEIDIEDGFSFYLRC